jgi:hypothetical protein
MEIPNMFGPIRHWIRGLRWKLIRARYAYDLQNEMIMNPRYAEDGLITNHLPVFLEDCKFMESYKKGVATGALEHHRGQITWRAYLNVKLAQRALSIPGDFVECGVGKGLYSKTICEYLNFNLIPRKFYLFDTFRGIPIEKLDKSEVETALRFNANAYLGDYFDQASETFYMFENVKLVKGSLPEMLDGISFDDGIAYLQIDMNNADAEIKTLQKLLPFINSGGVIIFDDFAYGPEFAVSRRLISKYSDEYGLQIITMPTGQGVILI